MNYGKLSMAEWTEQNRPENRAHFENDYKSYLAREAHRILFEEVFDARGNFVMPYFDPYRTKDDTPQNTLRNFLFDCGGAVHEHLHACIHTMLTSGAYSWSSDIVKLYWAEEHGSNTSNSYPAIYMWK